VHKLSTSFVLGYHGCDKSVGEALLKAKEFQVSQNDYDWLGEGVYFWEANPLRGLEFAREVSRREPKRLKKPFVIGAILDLGYCLDLTTSSGLQMVKEAYWALAAAYKTLNRSMPVNQPEKFRHPLDCAVINYLHQIRSDQKQTRIDSVKGIFQEQPELYPGSAFMEKNHIQIAIRNFDCIKGVFRVPPKHLDPNV
jgi:uncharacterized protein (DUF2267 family)